jgi:hypothetical protein
MRNQAPIDADLISIYHDESASATGATVQVTSSAVLLVVSGGGNAGLYTYTFAAYATMTLIVAAINDAAKGWIAVALGSGGENTTDLNTLAATSIFGTNNTQYLRGTDSYMLEQAINAASDQIERYCGRRFTSTTYKHRFNGTGTARLLLRQRPVTEVKRVALGLTGAMTIRNTSTTARWATVSNDGTNLSLVVDGGTPDTVPIGSNTITQLVAAVIANGNDWTAAVASSTAGAWPATELVQHEHRLALTENLELLVPRDYQDSYILNGSGGILTRSFPGHEFFGAWSFYGYHHESTLPHSRHNPGSHPGGQWPRGNFNVFVEYTAGESTIPYDLEQWCNQLASNRVRGGSHEGGLTSHSMPGFSESFDTDGAFTQEIRNGLSRFRMRPVPRYMDA